MFRKPIRDRNVSPEHLTRDEAQHSIRTFYEAVKLNNPQFRRFFINPSFEDGEA